MWRSVCADVLLDPRALGDAADDVGEDRLLQTSAGEAAKHRVGWLGLSGIADVPRLLGKARGWAADGLEGS